MIRAMLAALGVSCFVESSHAFAQHNREQGPQIKLIYERLMAWGEELGMDWHNPQAFMDSDEMLKEALKGKGEQK